MRKVSEILEGYVIVHSICIPCSYLPDPLRFYLHLFLGSLFIIFVTFCVIASFSVSVKGSNNASQIIVPNSGLLNFSLGQYGSD